MAHQYIIGVDETGMGALAGPLCVAAVAYAIETPIVSTVYQGLRGDRVLVVNDSKTFTQPAHREKLDEAVRATALAVTVVERSAAQIDERLIGAVFPEAIKDAISLTMTGMAAIGLSTDPALYRVMLDGELPTPEGLTCAVFSMVGGDKHVWQIGAASIVAKVHRDNIMMTLDERYPGYSLDTNKGYPVPAHKKKLKELGPCPIHRKTFKPVAEWNGLPRGFE